MVNTDPYLPIGTDIHRSYRYGLGDPSPMRCLQHPRFWKTFPLVDLSNYKTSYAEF